MKRGQSKCFTLTFFNWREWSEGRDDVLAAEAKLSPTLVNDRSLRSDTQVSPRQLVL